MAEGKAQANANYHTAGGCSVFEHREADPLFQEYRHRWFDNPARFIAGEFPIHLDIESTSACNLRCPFCATTHQQWGPNRPGYMDIGLYRHIIDEGVAHGLCSIKLSIRGEPLLHKELPEMVRYAKEKGILDVYFNTNAVLLEGDLRDELLGAGLDRISISFEGITKEVYEKHRVGADFEQVVENVRELRRAREASGRPWPRLRIQTVLLPELRASFPDYVRFWQPIVDEVGYLDAREEVGRGSRGVADLLLASAAGDWACPFLWQRMMILWDGTVLPCLLHAVTDFSEMVLGRAGRDSLQKLWTSSSFENHRACHRAGQSQRVPACGRCSYREMELRKLEERKWQGAERKGEGS